MKRSATVLTYYYHVLEVDGEYKIKRSLFPNLVGSVYYSTLKAKSEKRIEELKKQLQ